MKVHFINDWWAMVISVREETIHGCEFFTALKKPVSHLKNSSYSERRCVSDQQPELMNRKVGSVSDKLLRCFQTNSRRWASAIGRETQQRVARIVD